MKIISRFLFVLFAQVIFPDERPNILVIMADDMSLRINALGDKTAITPNLDCLLYTSPSPRD